MQEILLKVLLNPGNSQSTTKTQTTSEFPAAALPLKLYELAGGFAMYQIQMTLVPRDGIFELSLASHSRPIKGDLNGPE